MCDELVLLEPSTVVPAAWRNGENPPAVFNPAIVADGDGWIAAVRVVGADGARRIALCRLGADLQPRPGSIVAWSDHVQFAANTPGGRARTWFADPRLYRWKDRLVVYWNSGWHEPENQQFLQATDPESLLPIGPAVPLQLEGAARRPLEKNWLFFGATGERVLYAPAPLTVFSASPESGVVRAPTLARCGWDGSGFTERFGQLRGGAPPVEIDGEWFVICHAVAGEEGNYRYRPFAVRFAERGGFHVTGVPAQPLPLLNPFGGARQSAKLNPAVGEVVYPGGAVWHDGFWTISYGINDEQAAICRLSHAELLRTLTDVE